MADRGYNVAHEGEMHPALGDLQSFEQLLHDAHVLVLQVSIDMV